MIKIKFNKAIGMIKIYDDPELDDALFDYIATNFGIDIFLHEKKKRCTKFTMNTSILFDLMKKFPLEDYLVDV